jgi:hypothetical protein
MPYCAKGQQAWKAVVNGCTLHTQVLRAVALMANGVTPVEPNPDFIDDVRQAAGGKAVILACEGGGTTVPTPSFQWVRPSCDIVIGNALLSAALLKKNPCATRPAKPPSCAATACRVKRHEVSRQLTGEPVEPPLDMPCRRMPICFT